MERKKFFAGIYDTIDESKLYTKLKLPVKKTRFTGGNDGTIFMDIFGKASDAREVPDVNKSLPPMDAE